MPNNQSERTLDLSAVLKEARENKTIFDLNKNPNEESFFEPIPNGFYGFSIDILAPANVFPNPVETIDVDYIDITNQKLL